MAPRPRTGLGCSRRRRLGILAIALLLAASLAGRLHEVLVPHAVCAEHGELVELAAGAILPAAHETGSDRTRIADASSQGETQHEHCALVVLRRAHDAVDDRLVPQALPSVAPRGGAVRSAARAELAVPLVLLAPKHSPPAIA